MYTKFCKVRMKEDFKGIMCENVEWINMALTGDERQAHEHSSETFVVQFVSVPVRVFSTFL